MVYIYYVAFVYGFITHSTPTQHGPLIQQLGSDGLRMYIYNNALFGENIKITTSAGSYTSYILSYEFQI